VTIPFEAFTDGGPSRAGSGPPRAFRCGSRAGGLSGSTSRGRPVHEPGFERAVEPGEIVQALRSYGVTQTEVGAVAGVSDRAVRAWARSGIRPEHYDRLAELRDVVVVLSDSLTERGIGQWPHARNRLLGGERPIEVRAEGRFGEVRAGAQAFVDGSSV